MSLSRASIRAVVVAAALVAASPRSLRAEPPAGEAAPATSSSASTPGSGLRTVGIVNVAVGGAFLLGGVLVALSGLSLKSTVDRECPGKMCPPSANGDLDALRGRATAANVFWVAGLVTAGTGVGLLIASGKSERDDSGERRGALVVTPSLGGVAALLTF